MRRPVPSLAAKGAVALRRLLLALADRVVPAQFALFDLSLGGARSSALATVARLGVADHLANGPRTAEELAENLAVDADALHRVLRALVLERVFVVDRSGRYGLTARGQRLRTDHPESLRDWITYFHSESNQAAWGELDDVVRTGRPAFPRVFGMSVWEWFKQHPDEGRLFAAAMRRVTEFDAPEVVAAYPWPSQGVVCDLAGGAGTLLSHVLQANPNLRGILVESPHVLTEAEELLRVRGVRDRVDLRAGDLFGGIDAPADIYLLKNVLHDWDDETSTKILLNARDAMPPGTTLVVIELLQERNVATYPGSLTDLQMMAVCDAGRERSLEEIQALLHGAGFESGPAYRTGAGSGLVTGLPTRAA
jgi:hypothetical protein